MKNKTEDLDERERESGTKKMLFLFFDRPCVEGKFNILCFN